VVKTSEVSKGADELSVEESKRAFGAPACGTAFGPIWNVVVAFAESIPAWTTTTNRYSPSWASEVAIRMLEALSNEAWVDEVAYLRNLGNCFGRPGTPPQARIAKQSRVPSGGMRVSWG
jgi:hypothetical protein